MKNSGQSGFIPCPDFNLAPLEKFDPRVFISQSNNDKELKELMLGLACIYNDFKGLEWWLWQLHKGRPENQSEISPYAGQYNGMIGQIMRYFLGIFHEMLVLLEKKSSVFNDPKFRTCVAQLSPKAKEMWNDLIWIVENWSTNVPKYGSFRAFLHAIRSKGAFHFDVKLLSISFKEHFSGTLPHQTDGYASLGRNIEETRFYMADAAQNRLVARAFDNQDIELDRINDLVKMMNEPIKTILHAFLTEEQARLQSNSS